MALSASGIGSGLDINGLVGQLMTIEQRPLTLLAAKEASFQAKLSAFGQIKGSLSSLQTAANALKDASLFSTRKASVSGEAAFTASAGNTAAAGSVSIEVIQLATAQRAATSADTAFDPAAGGTLEITFGSIATGVFAPGEEAPRSLNFAGGTIEALRDAINSGDLGVSANVIFNGSVKQLVLTGNETGAEQAFSLGGTLGLSFDPASVTTPSSPVFSAQAATNARLSVDSIVIERNSNSITDVLDGVTLTLTKEAPGSTGTLTIAQDRAGARAAIDALVKAFNDSAGALRSQTAFNTATSRGAVLTGDSTARSVQNQLRSLIGEAITGLGATTRLSDIGIAVQKDGTLAIDSTKLDAALADPERGVAEFFAGAEGVGGFAQTVASRLDALIDSNGLITTRTEGIDASVKLIGKQREALNLRLEKVQQRLLAQFSALDSMVASMTQTSNFLTQQLTALAGFTQ